MIDELKGKIAQGGFAAGQAFVLIKSAGDGYVVSDPAEELARLDSAAARLEKKLRARMEGDTAELTEAQIMLLCDDGYIGAARRLISEEGRGAAPALRAVEGSLCEMLESAPDDYIRERASDIRGLTDTLIDIISGRETEYPDTPFILVAKEPSPCDITLALPGLLLGIVSEKGSPASHVSVLAGGLGIPYLYGISGAYNLISSGDFLILDGGSGLVKINPSEEERDRALGRMKEALNSMGDSEHPATKTRVCVNVGGLIELGLPGIAHSDGIGLVRSEFLFTGRDKAPSEEEQFEAYRAIVSAADGREAVIRTMDIGSDKQVRWLSLPEEKNPALGLRGIRVSLQYRKLLHTQLRALVRAAAYGDLKIMIPMVTSEWEVDEVYEELKAVAVELEAEGAAHRIPVLGVMIETPAAVMIANRLAAKAGFFSIGTNDLTQYALAVDREAAEPGRYFDPLHEGVFRMIEMTVRAAHENNIPVAVCGELAGDPDAVSRLIGLGIDELSVSAGKINSVRQLVSDAEKSHNYSEGGRLQMN